MDIATLGLAVDSREVADASKDLDRIREAAARAEKQADSFGKRVEDAGKRAAAANDNSARAADRAAKAYDGYSRAAQLAARAMGAIVGAAIGKALIDFADTWSDINARVGLAVRNMDASGAVLDRLATVARRTYSALDLTAESFVRNASVLRELGKSTAEQLDYTEALNLALVVSGARGEHAARVQDALGKAMAAGKLRGDELNTVIERGGRVAEILAEELGISQNQLRKLGSEGKITGDTIYNALTKRLEQLQEEAESMPATIGDGLMLIRNALFQTIGVFDQANGLSATFAEGLIAVADNIGRVVTYAATAVTAFGTYYVGAMVAAYVSTMTLNGALVLLRAALIRTGIGALIIGAGELVYQFGRLVSAAGGFGNAMGLLGDLASEVWERIKLDAHSAYLGVQAVWEKIKLGFLLGLSVMQKAWTDFLYFLADTAPTEGLSRTLTESAMKAGTEYLATERSIKGAREEIERLGAASDEAAAKARAPLESIAAIRKALSDSSDASVDLDEKLKRVSSGFDGAGKAAKKAAQELQQFKDRADALAEQMFPGEYALREAYELMDLLDRFDGKLDDFQRKAVEHRIDLMFASANAGVRDLSQETQKAGKEMEKALQPVADLLYDLFAKPVKDMDDLLDRVAQFGAQMAKQNFSALFGGGPAAANDNLPEMAGMIGREVHKGARKGTQEGSKLGTFDGLFTALGMSEGSAKAAGGALGAALGGFGMGYQSQDPLMGGLGGALSGAMSLGALFPGVGHIAGAIIGGIAGAIGGLLGKSKVKKEAQAELAKNMGAIEGILATGEGTGVGAVATTFREYFDEMASAVELAAKAGNQELRNRLSASAGTFFQRLYVDWMRGFEGLTESLRAGLGDSSPFMKAASEVQGLRESLMGLIADARFVNEKFIEMHGLQPGDQMFDQLAWQVEEMTRAARAMALSVLTGAQEFTAMEEAVQRIRGAASALQITLEQLGMAADEAAHAIEQGVVAALHKLRLALQTDLARSINDLAGFGFLNEFMDAQSAYETRLRDLAALGMDSSLAVTELNLRLRQITSEASLTDDQLRQVAAAFPLLADGLLALIGGGGGDTAMALANAKTALDQAKADLRSAYEAEMRLLEQVVSRHEALIKSLQRFRDDLRLDSNLSPLDPWQRLQEAQKQFQETAALALTGDEDALGRLEDVSRAYLTEAKAYYASSEAYFSIFTEVESILDQALAMAGNQLSEAEQQLQALKDLVSPLIDIDNSVMSVADAIAAFQQAEADHAAAQAANDNYQNSLFEQMLSLLGNINIGHVPDQPGGSATPIASMYDQYLGASADQYAAGYANLQGLVDSGAMTISEMEQAFKAAQAAIAAGQLSMPGYSRGGFTGMMPTNAVAGVVHGQEFVAHAEATRRWRPQLEAMNAGGNPFGGDNSALIAALMTKIEALQEEIRRNTQVTAAGAQEQVAATRGTTRAVDKQGEEARRLAHQRAA